MTIPIDSAFYAKLSSLAYQDHAAISAYLGENGFLPPVFFDKDDTRAFLYVDADTVVIAFRGTDPEDLKNWLTDVDAKLVPYRDQPAAARSLMVHDGFQTALGSIWDDILIAMLPHADKRLIVTGHSLGAALATLAAMRFADLGHPVAGLYAYGSPRVGDPAFCRAFDALGIRSYRFVNDTDGVPRVPTRLMGYGHVGQLFYFGPDGKLAPDNSAWDQLLLDVRGTADDFLSGRLGALSCHFIANYIKACEANITSP